MKSINTKIITQKICVFTLIALLFSSCVKEKISITEEEVAKVTAEALGSSFNGLNYRITIEDSLVAANSISCGQRKDYSIISNDSVLPFSDSYMIISHELICNDTPTISNSFNATYHFNAPLISSEVIIYGDGTLRGFESTSNNLVFNGTFNFTKNSILILRKSTVTHYYLHAVLTNLIYDKTSKKIASGTGTATLSINNKTTNINIEFTGNDLAKININGKTFSVNLVMGQIVE